VGDGDGIGAGKGQAGKRAAVGRRDAATGPGQAQLRIAEARPFLGRRRWPSIQKLLECRAQRFDRLVMGVGQGIDDPGASARLRVRPSVR
jgi:hypothetical protein